MLEEAVAQLKAGIEEPAEDHWSPTIAIGAPVMIPEAYVPDLQLRLGLYRRLSTLETDGEIDAFGAELVDRFGALPPEVGQLLKIMAIKVLCRRANIEKVDGGPKGIIVSFRDNSFANPTGLISLRDRAGVLRQGSPGHEDRLHPRCRGSRRAHQGDEHDPAQSRADRGKEGGLARPSLSACCQAVRHEDAGSEFRFKDRAGSAASLT